jgi:hypothetical protein
MDKSSSIVSKSFGVARRINSRAMIDGSLAKVS